jgi:hypothetical protein
LTGLPTPNDPSAAELDQQFERGLGRIRSDAGYGLFIKNRAGWSLSPLKEEEMERLLTLYSIGFELFTGSYHENPQDPLNQFQDELGLALEGKIMELVHIGEIAGGTIFIQADCPDIQIVSVTAARTLEAAQDPDTFRSFCLPDIPLAETEEEAAQRILEENDLIWVLAFLDPDALFNALRGRFISIIDDFSPPGTGNGSGGPDLHPPGSGPFPPPENPDTGSGAADWSDTGLGASLQMCINGDALIYHNADTPAGQAPPAVSVPLIPVWELGKDLRQAIDDIVVTFIGRHYARWQLDGVKLKFDGIALTAVNITKPVALNFTSVPFEIPNLEIPPRVPRYPWPDPAFTDFNVEIQWNGATASAGTISLAEWIFSEQTFGRWGNPSTRDTSLKGLETLLHFTLVPPIAGFSNATELLKAHNGYRVFLHCFQIYASSFLRYLPYDFTAHQPPNADDGWGGPGNSGTPGLEWLGGDAHGASRTGFLIPYGDSADSLHFDITYLSDNDQDIHFWLSDCTWQEDNSGGTQDFGSSIMVPVLGGWAGGVTGAWRTLSFDMPLSITLDDTYMWRLSWHYTTSNFLIRRIAIQAS